MITVFVGGLGSGKTLCLTWLILLYYKKLYPIFSNYHLKYIDYQYIEPELQEGENKKQSGDELVTMIDGISNGFLALDELWLMLDSRASFSKQNKFISKILIKSRKRKIDIGYTSQDFMQTEKRLRKITDVIGYPQFDKKRHICSLEICDRYTNETLRNYRINAKMIYPFYSTEEEINY